MNEHHFPGLLRRPVTWVTALTLAALLTVVCMSR